MIYQISDIICYSLYILCKTSYIIYYRLYNMEPAKLDDRELGCIDLFLFCCLLSSGLVWPTSWAILASSWAILASSWTILAPSGAIRAPSWLPKASRSLPRLNQTIPRGAQRLPEPKSHKHVKVTRLQIEILVRNVFSFWRPFPIRVKCRFKKVFNEKRLLLKKHENMSIA